MYTYLDICEYLSAIHYLYLPYKIQKTQRYIDQSIFSNLYNHFILL